MVERYDPNNLQPLKDHFPAERRPDLTRFEIAIAATGGTSTGAYIAGVLDFIWEAFEEWTAAQARGEAPKHDVRITTLVGTSAGGLSVSLASMMGVKQFPHVYDDRVWKEGLGKTGQQDKDANPLWRAWVKEITLDKLLSNPKQAETGEPSLFYDAPSDVRTTVFELIRNAQPAQGRKWLAHPIDLRLVVGDLRGVPFALDFRNTQHQPGVNQRLLMHRDHIAFAVQSAAAGAIPTGLGDAPDAHHVDPQGFPQGDAWSLFSQAAVASAAIPLVFQTKKLKQAAAAYDWRNSCWFDGRGALVDLPLWDDPAPTDFVFTATDGGLFDDAPFDLARRRLAGARGQNPRAALDACRAVILIDPLVNDTARTPTDVSDADNVTTNAELTKTLASLFFGPVDQARLSTFDLALIKDEGIYSRYMISPSRESAHDSTVMWGPALSLMTSPMKAVLGFAHQAFREHDFLLGRRNAQRFLELHFTLPKRHDLFKGQTGWTDDEEARDEYPIVPLRGTAAIDTPLPKWPWEALTPDDIDRLTEAFGKRADALRKNLTKRFAGGWGWAVGLVWGLAFKKKVRAAFRDQLASAKKGLDPAHRVVDVRSIAPPVGSVTPADG
ncbi:hypothetical protein [Phenylobacterium sp.]|jgi:hypothetical protein|uniref:hypothetical protein n=1 Tax=Phenylobacterium sp. TaxID=1871053 RepID=UPI002F950FDC